MIWTALDWWATGDPKFSLTHTSGLAEELGRTSGGLSAVPSTTVKFLKNLDKVPVFYAGILGVVIAVLLTPRRARMPLALLVIGLGTFVLVGLAGLSVIDRYLLVPSLLVMVFAGVALGGWTMLRAGRARTLWAVGSVALIIYGVAFTATRVNLSTFTNELTFRGDSHASLRTLLNDPKVRAGLRCGPVSTPNHKLIPDTRWLLDASARKVIARSDAHERSRIGRGVAIYAVNRLSLLRSGFTVGDESTQDTFNSIPMAGFSAGGRSRRTTAPMSVAERAVLSPPASEGSGQEVVAQRRWPWWIGLAVVLAAALGLRVWGVKQGLPFAYNADENAHFVPNAIGLFGHGWDPHYFVNPPAYTYLLHVVFDVWFGGRAGGVEGASPPTRPRSSSSRA